MMGYEHQRNFSTTYQVFLYGFLNHPKSQSAKNTAGSGLELAPGTYLMSSVDVD